MHQLPIGFRNFSKITGCAVFNLDKLWLVLSRNVPTMDHAAIMLVNCRHCVQSWTIPLNVLFFRFKSCKDLVLT